MSIPRSDRFVPGLRSEEGIVGVYRSIGNYIKIT
jgi:hypothetical protein